MTPRKKKYDEQDHMKFGELDEFSRKCLIDLSMFGFIYIGRTGAGLTYDFRRACMKTGTLKAIEEEARFQPPETAESMPWITPSDCLNIGKEVQAPSEIAAGSG